MARTILVLAMAQNGTIGSNNQLPWRLSDDLKHFKQLTLGHPIIMGRKTFASFPKPLPQRAHIVITRQLTYEIPYQHCYVVHSLQQAIEKAKTLYEGEHYIIGGAEIAKQAVAQDLIDKIWLTRVKAKVAGDTFFTDIDWSVWQQEQSKQYVRNEKNDYDFEIVLLNKKSI
ncbi:MAG: dihydrofolate reductase [Bacteroidota bacterium]